MALDPSAVTHQGSPQGSKPFREEDNKDVETAGTEEVPLEEASALVATVIYNLRAR